MSQEEQTSATFTVTLPVGPYPGLRPFNTDEWPIFFGRERMADEVVARLIRDQFIVVHGDSGCGKSSLIRAGVLPRLEQESTRGGLSWRTGVTQPRNAPLQLLAEAFAALDGRQGDQSRILEMRRILNYGDEAPPILAQQLRRGPTDHICVLIDQFEELFAFARRSNGADASLFVEILVALLDQPPPGLYAVVTMRSEFLGACAHFPGLAEAINRAQYLLPRMTHADLTRAIREPAELYGGKVSAELAERLMNDSGGSQDQLPLIQHGLMQLSQIKRASAPVGTGEPNGWRIDLRDYLDAGDLSEALSNHADQVLSSIEAPPFPIGEKLFRALTEINADGQAVRRPQTVAQLAEVCSCNGETIMRIVNAFRAEGASFLTPFGSAPIGPDTLIDISHEALIRCWSRISAPSGWLTHEFQDGLLWRSLRVQADDFARDSEHLLALATAEDQSAWMKEHCSYWAERYGGGWDRVERMIAVSLNTGRAARRERQAAAQRRQQLIIAFGVFLFVVAIGLALLNRRANYALAQANDASAASLWNRLDFANADRLLDDELNALWEVRMAGDAVRRSFFAQLTTVPERLLRLSRRPQPVLRALTTKWTAERAGTLREAVVRQVLASDEAGVIALAPAVQATASLMTPAQAQATFDRYLQLVQSAATATAPATIAAATGALGQQLEPEAAVAAFTRVLQTTPAASEYVAVVGGVSASLARRLPTERMAPSLAATLGAIATTVDANLIVALTPTAQELAKRLDADQLGLQLIRVLSGIGKARSKPEQAALVAVALEITGRTTAPQATTAFKLAIDSGLALSDDPQLGLVMGGLAARATADDMVRLAQPLVAALANRKPDQRSGNLALIVHQLKPRVSKDEQRRINDILIRQLGVATDALDANVLARAIGDDTTGLEPLSPEQTRLAMPRLVAAAHYGSEFVAVDGLAKAAGRVATQLTPAEARRDFSTVLTLMARTTATGKLNALTALLPALASRLAPEDAAGFLPQAWQMIRGTVDANQLAAFSTIVPNLAERLPPAGAARSLAACVDFLTKSTDPDQIGALSIAARALGERAPAEARSASLALTQTPVAEAGPDRLARLAPMIPLTAASMSRAQADALFPRLVTSMESTVYEPQLAALAAAAGKVLEVVSPEQRVTFARLVARALHGETDTDRIVALTGTMDALTAQIVPTSPGLLQALVAWAATPEKARAALQRLIDRPATATDAPARIRVLVETLQYPTVTGDNAVMVLDALKRADAEAPGAEAGIDASLAWVARKYPAAIEKTAACPAPLLPTLSCPVATQPSFFENDDGDTQFRVLRRFDANQLL